MSINSTNWSCLIPVLSSLTTLVGARNPAFQVRLNFTLISFCSSHQVPWAFVATVAGCWGWCQSGRRTPTASLGQSSRRVKDQAMRPPMSGVLVTALRLAGGGGVLRRPPDGFPAFLLPPPAASSSSHLRCPQGPRCPGAGASVHG